MPKKKNRWTIAGSVLLGMQWLRAESYPVGQTDDITIWIALFGLAVIGIFALYLSSDKVKVLTRQYTEMLTAQREIETRQNILLGVIGDRLENSTVGIRRHREVFEGQSRETLDWDTINNEMTRFRRDESLLLDAMQDLQDFSRIRLEKLQLETVWFDLGEMLKRLSQQMEPHYLLKRNELVYRFDPAAIGYIRGDARRLEQILRTFLVELGQDLYDATVILSIDADVAGERVMFDVSIPQGEGRERVLLMREDVLVAWSETGDAHHSTRKLKNFIAHELLRLMGGALRPMSQSDEEVHYRITLPWHVKAGEERKKVPDAPLVIVSHNRATVRSFKEMLSGSLDPRKIDVVLPGDALPEAWEKYETVVITYAALGEEWIGRLLAQQCQRPLRVILLKNGFERHLPIPEGLGIVQTLRLPLLPEKVFEAMAKKPLMARQGEAAS